MEILSSPVPGLDIRLVKKLMPSIINSVLDPDPHFLGLLDPDPDPPVRGRDPDPSIIMQK